MFDCISTLLGLLPFRSVWVVGGDFDAEVGFRGVGEDATLGQHAHGRRTRSGHQLVEWAQRKTFVFFCLTQDRFVGTPGSARKAGRDVCRSRDHKFLGATKEVNLAKGWIYRAPGTPRRFRRPSWVALRGFEKQRCGGG